MYFFGLMMIICDVVFKAYAIFCLRFMDFVFFSVGLDKRRFRDDVLCFRVVFWFRFVDVELLIELSLDLATIPFLVALISDILGYRDLVRIFRRVSWALVLDVLLLMS